ncbi:unnamed protein product [Clonostachys rosea]|uniref:Aminoglycoside phosphotransferase domain-containing protein n=1 Tax=Bionectria ochroleuca TaxID=29856 RepID=A0ABY6U8M6_BIOOC|nr:unnamed protein product [Clonostachys rosea]
MNEIGVPYMLMSKAPGKSLSSFDWPWFTLEMPAKKRNTEIPLLPISTSQKEKIMHQLGIIVAKLSQLRFDRIGSLFEDEGGYTIKTCLSMAHTCYGRDSLTLERGPFETDVDYYKSLTSISILHAQQLPMTPHCLFASIPAPDDFSKWSDYSISINRWNDFMAIGDKTDSCRNRMDCCIASQLAQEMIPSLVSQPYPAGFPLRHMDLNFDNIFVDDEMNVTCVIDWAFCSSVPFVELLATPGMPYPRDLPSQNLTSAYRAGFEQTSTERLPWEGTEKIWHLQRFFTMDQTQLYNHFRRFYSLATEDEQLNLPLLLQAAREKVSPESLGLAEDLPADTQKEDSFFTHEDTTNRKALARKLTVMMELNQSFVADQKLWRWLADAVDAE